MIHLEDTRVKYKCKHKHMTSPFFKLKLKTLKFTVFQINFKKSIDSKNVHQ